MSRSYRKTADAYYDSDKSTNKYGKIITSRVSRKVKKEELRNALISGKEDEVFSLQNKFYVYGWMFEKGLMLNRSETLKMLEHNLRQEENYYHCNFEKRKRYISFKMRK